MSAELTNNDYESILSYYKIPIPKSKRILKKKAEDIMAQKLCKCIKKLDPENEAKSIGICTKTIFNRRGLTRGKFRCKKRQSVKIKRKVFNKTLKKR